MRRRRAAAVALFAVALLLASVEAEGADAAESAPPKRVLILYDENQDFSGLAKLDQSVKATLKAGMPVGLEVYTEYLNRRNASYLKLESEAGSALEGEAPDWHPFQADTGYHRIAVAAVRALSGIMPEQRMILDVANQGSIEGLQSDDVVEVGCVIQNGAITADRIGPVPEQVRGLLHATKAYERATVKAAVTGADHLNLAWALAQNPLVGDWDAAVEYVAQLSAVKSHHQGF